MGNPRFKLSRMMPNSWFHKLKHLTKNPNISRHPLPDTLHPAASPSNRPRRRTIYMPSPRHVADTTPPRPPADDIIIELDDTKKTRRSSTVVRIRGKKARGKEERMLVYGDSRAIVKASLDPEKDFGESMMEMIVENDIREVRELEHLLACYLSLNADRYRGVIIRAFQYVWFNLPHPIF